MPPKQVETPTPLIQPTKLLIIDLEKEWEDFNELISTEEKNIETPRNPILTTIEMIIKEVVNTQEIEHIPVVLSYEIILKIEEIPPLDVFYSPQHKLVVRRQRKKRKIDSMLSLEAEPLDIL